VRILWTDLAQADLDHIESWITTDNSFSVAVDVVLRVIDTVELVLGNHPRAGRIGRVKGTRELVLEGIPYVAIYRIVEKPNPLLQILRVMHDAQQWPTESSV
jgi:toxin ParE1/3/4